MKENKENIEVSSRFSNNELTGHRNKTTLKTLKVEPVEYPTKTAIIIPNNNFSMKFIVDHLLSTGYRVIVVTEEETNYEHMGVSTDNTYLHLFNFKFASENGVDNLNKHIEEFNKVTGLKLKIDLLMNFIPSYEIKEEKYTTNLLSSIKLLIPHFNDDTNPFILNAYPLFSYEEVGHYGKETGYHITEKISTIVSETNISISGLSYSHDSQRNLGLYNNIKDLMYIQNKVSYYTLNEKGLFEINENELGEKVPRIYSKNKEINNLTINSSIDD